MPVDPSIALAGNNSGLNWNGPISLADLALKAQQVKQMQTATQSRNALTAILANPQAYDQSGNLTPQALQGVTAVDPATGLKFREATIDEQVQKAQAAHYKSETGKLKFDALSGLAGVATDAYDDALAKGATPKDAAGAASAARNEAAKNSGGVLSDDDIKGVVSSPFDPVQAKAFARTNKEWATQKDNAAKGARDDKRLDLQSDRDAENAKRTDALISRQDDNASKGKFTPYQEPDTKDDKGNTVPGRTLSFDSNTGKYFDTDGKPVTPGKVTKVGSTSTATPRSAQALAAQRYIAENPNATSADIQNFIAKGTARSAAQRSLEAGPMGNQLKSLGVATDHLNTLRDLSDAFASGDEKTIAAAKAAWEKEFGNPAPANIDLAAQFVAPELIKAIEGSPGGVAERDELAKAFNSARGQSNVSGAIDTAYALMGGQLNGLRNQVVKVDKLASDDEFNDMLPSAALDAMRKHQTKSGKATAAGAPPSPPPKTAAAPADHPEAKRAPDGNWYISDPARPGKYLRVDQ